MDIRYQRELNGVDWAEMKRALAADDFDNGRSPEQLRDSFANSGGSCIAYHEGKIIGTARVLTDGVCNAYIVDVWTMRRCRHRGIATRMIETLLRDLPGQHVYLFTSRETMPFYQKLGFAPQGVGMSRVVGRWLSGGPG